MRIIFFNIWRGKIWDKFGTFLDSYAKTADIFCFMESAQELHPKIATKLAGFNQIYISGGLYKPDNTEYGQSVFIKNGLTYKKPFIKQISPDWPGRIIDLEISVQGRDLNMVNIHGVSQPGSKLDSPTRIWQSKEIIKRADGKNSVIIGGDFNLLPDTESIKLIENSGYKNLIKEYRIKTTRNNLSWSQFKDLPNFTKQYYADYCFVSPHISVTNFSVPNLEASDHEPLVLDFEI